MKISIGMKWLFFVGVCIVALFPLMAFADVRMTEIMYDVSGSDTDKEWVELWNDSPDGISILGWKLSDGSSSKHVLNVPPKNGGQGMLQIPPGGYVILTENASAFLKNHGGFTGTVIDTVLHLSNTGKTLTLFNASSTIIDSVTYTSTWGAAEDGNSLQKKGDQWVPAVPTPGSVLVEGNVIKPPSVSTSKNVKPVISISRKKDTKIPQENKKSEQNYSLVQKESFIASSTEVALVVVPQAKDITFEWISYIGLFLIILSGVVVVVFFKGKHSEADEFEIIEKIDTE